MSLWEALCSGLRERLSSASFQEWVEPCVPQRLEGDVLWVQVPNPSNRIWIEQQLAEEFHDALGQAGLSHLKLMFTVTDLAITQKQTQTNSGGMSDVYLDSGTYLKSFYTVLFQPSCTTVERMGGNTYHRIHHRIEWEHCVPKILNERYRKV